MAMKLMYITNNPQVAKIAEENTVDKIWVDLETLGKKERQFGMNTVQSNHTIQDVSIIRNVINKSRLLVRINPINTKSKDEIEEVISRGADEIMLPFFETIDEVEKFSRFVDGRAKIILLLETIKAEKSIDKILKNIHIDSVHIGLNDLHLQYGNRFMFELLSNGKVEEICRTLKDNNVEYGFGGIARLDEGLLPARHILGEHYRLGSNMVILSRSFYDSWISDDYEEIDRVFRHGILEIREYEERLKNESFDFFLKNKQLVDSEVKGIVDRIGKA